MFWLVLLHVLGASVWVGGHLYLALRIVPKAILKQDSQLLLDFANNFEKLGMSALIIQVLTGFKMASTLLPDWSLLFAHSVDNPLRQISILLSMKICWLFLTVVTALSAQFLVIPKLKQAQQSHKYRYLFVMHILVVTLLALIFLVTGVLFRFGW